MSSISHSIKERQRGLNSSRRVWTTNYEGHLDHEGCERLEYITEGISV